MANYGSNKFGLGTSLKLARNKGKPITSNTLNNYVKNHNKSDLQDDLYIFDEHIWRNIIMDDINEYNSSLFDFVLWKTRNLNIEQNGFTFTLSINSNNKTGTSFHQHGAVWCAILKGRKKWFLYPSHITPPGGYLTGYSTYHWFNTIYKYLNKTIVDQENMEYDMDNEMYLNFLYNSDLSAIKSIDDIMLNSNDWNSYKPLECVTNEGDILYLPDDYWHGVINIDKYMVGIIVKDDNKKQHSNYYPHKEESQESPKKMKKEKIKYYEKCILRDPTFIHCYLSLAKFYYFKLKNKNKAERLLKLAYLLNSNNQQIQDALIKIFKKTNQLDLISFVKNNQPLP